MTSTLKRWFEKNIHGRGQRSVERALVFRTFRKDVVAIGSLIILFVFMAGAIFAPWLTPYPEEGKGSPNIANKFIAPGLKHPFGTDNLGRDLLARVLFGGRSSLSIGFLVVLLAVVIGVPLGTVAGYYGGWLDDLIMRLTDVFLSFPPLLLAIALGAALERSFVNTMVAISITWWPWYARLARSQTVSLRERPFIEAARGIGVSDVTNMVRHVVPNIMAPILVQGTMDVGSAILTGAAMSFIGLGPQPPTPDWGKMISTGRIYFLNQPWFAIFPGMAIFLVTLSFNMIGDKVRDVADPRTRRGA
jgi:peptide/nickel transport system permease protein